MYETATGHAVRESLKEIVTTDGPPSEAVRRAMSARVSAAVDELKGMGWPVEKILVRLKQLADEVGFAPRHDPFGRDREAIIAEILQLCLNQYYGARN
jgi:hypothetical protein